VRRDSIGIRGMQESDREQLELFGVWADISGHENAPWYAKKSPDEHGFGQLSVTISRYRLYFEANSKPCGRCRDKSVRSRLADVIGPRYSHH
jgi:hypothetical protein